MADPLKLRAEDEEDLAVVSTILQDALVPILTNERIPVPQKYADGGVPPNKCG